MAIACILDFPRGSLAEYDAVIDRMDLGDRLPPGALFHAAGTGPSGDLRVTDVWESAEAFDAFAAAQIGPRSAEAGLAAPDILQVEVAMVRDAGLPRHLTHVVQVVRLDLDAEGFRAIDAEIVGGGADTVPDGLAFHVNGPLPDGGWLVIDAWTSRSKRDRFIADRVMPAARRHGLAAPVIDDFDVHNVLEARPTRADILRVIDEQDAAFNRHDAAAVAATYAPDAVIHDQAASAPIRGRAGVEEFIGGYLHAFPDLRWERIAVEIDGAIGVEQWRASGRHDGDLPGVPATRRRMTIEGCSVLHFGPDGLVHEEENYWDEAAMLRQLGVLEPVTVA